MGRGGRDDIPPRRLGFGKTSPGVEVEREREELRLAWFIARRAKLVEELHQVDVDLGETARQVVTLGGSWRQVGEALGVSPQRAHQRYGKP